MNRETICKLRSPIGKAAIAEAEMLGLREEDFLSGFAVLGRKGFDADLSRAALETAFLRKRASGKFSRAAEMYFLREALEQSSSEVCSRHRAKRFRGAERIGDLGCGIGGDTIALADAAPVTAVDREEERLWLARWNAEVCRPANPVTWIAADIARTNALRTLGLQRAFVFCDPSRREQGRRIFSVREYSPDWEVLLAWREDNPQMRLCAKVSPGVRLEEIRTGDPEVEFVSVEGDLKEAVVWFDAFKTTSRRATLLPADVTMTDQEPESDALSSPREYLYEPDPSILRAGLVRHLAAKLSAARIDPQIAYLASDSMQASIWARVFRIEETMPFGLKRLREWLRARHVGKVVVKKRGSPIEPLDLEKQLRLSGDEERILFLTKAGGKPVVLVGREEIMQSQ